MLMSKICLIREKNKKMNLLTSGLPMNCGRKFWRIPCPCLQDYKSKPIYFHKTTYNKKEADLVSYDFSVVCGKRYKMCSLPVSSNFTVWTQVRFQKDYPKLHRDMIHPNFDAYRKEKFKDVSKTTWHAGDDKYGYTYVAGFFGLLCGMYGLKTELVHFLTSMSAPADVLALAAIEVDIKNIAPGMCNSYKWRGKPLFIKHRTDAEISAEANTPLSALRDPQTPEERTIKPEWLIVIGICTHLGCVPVPNSGDWTGGFYCPCHGSHYDNVGRTRKGPAPLNLEVPPYKFLTDTIVIVG